MTVDRLENNYRSTDTANDVFLSMYDQAMMFIEGDQYEEAISLLKEIERQNKELPGINSALARAYQRTNESEMQRYLNQLRNQAVTKDIDFMNLAYIHEFEKDYESAIQAWDRAIDLSPEKHWNYLERAETYFSGGYFDEAIASAAEFLDLVADDHFVRFGLSRKGVFLTAARRFEEALQCFSNAISLLDEKGGESEGYLSKQMAVPYIFLGQPDKAVELLNRGISLCEGDATGQEYFNRAVANRACRNKKEAVADYEKAIEKGIELTLPSHWAYLAESYYYTKDYQKAYEMWAKAADMEEEPESKADHLVNKARVLGLLSRYHEALEDLEHALSVIHCLDAPYDQEDTLRYLLAICYYDADLDEKIIEQITELQKKDKSNLTAEMLSTMARYASRAGDNNLALAVIQKALAADPDSQSVRKDYEYITLTDGQRRQRSGKELTNDNEIINTPYKEQYGKILKFEPRPKNTFKNMGGAAEPNVDPRVQKLIDFLNTPTSKGKKHPYPLQKISNKIEVELLELIEDLLEEEGNGETVTNYLREALIEKTIERITGARPQAIEIEPEPVKPRRIFKM